MLGHRELTAQDYVEILKRRFRLILICTLLLLGAGVGVSYILPPKYLSQTLVLIEQQKVPEDYVKPVVNEDLNSRLASMREQILSRSQIQPIIERFNLFPDDKSDMDERVDRTRKAIGINPIPASEGSHGMPGFYITFEARDPHIAQQVCGEITSLFVTANLDAREASAEGTTDFLKQQLDDAKDNLNAQDAKLAAFEEKNIGKLPGQTVQLGDVSLSTGSPNQSALGAISSQLDATTQKINSLQMDETVTESAISQQEQELSSADSGAGVSEDTLQTQLKDAITQKNQLAAIYTPDYPDVAAMQRKIDNLRKEIAKEAVKPEKPKTAQAPPDTPQLRQLKAQLHMEQQSMAAAKQEQNQLQQQLRFYEARIQASPQIEEEYKQITRDHDTALKFYNTLLAKMNESSMATALEQRQEGEQFRVMDAPNLPDAPVFPNHLKFAGGGLAGGLMVGLLLTALLEYRDTSLRSERDIWAFTKLPTLGVIGYIDDLAHPLAGAMRDRNDARKSQPLESSNG